MSQRNLSMLPPEVIRAVIGQLDNGRDRHSFANTCKFGTVMVLMKPDFDRILKPTPSSGQVASGRSSVMDAPSGSTKSNFESTPTITAGIAFALELSVGHVKVARQSLSLVFRGNFEERSRRMNHPNEPTRLLGEAFKKPEHRFVDSRGLKTTAPSAFEFNMPWQSWDIAILKQLSLQHLVRLKVPLGMHSDAFELSGFLKDMPRLESLAVTDIPDRPDFLGALPYLGLGILSRAASLKELNLWMTNYNRPNYYSDKWYDREMEIDEVFVKPRSVDWFFDSLFFNLPADVGEDDDDQQKYHELNDSKIKNERSETNEMLLLKLEKLRLRHVHLPRDAFEKTIDGSNLKELWIPFCKVDTKVWATIGTSSLVRLEAVNFDLLTDEFLEFLSEQTSLEFLSFARPADKCVPRDLTWFEGNESPRLNFEIYRRSPMLGQGTAWGRVSVWGQSLAQKRNSPYPKFEKLVESISRTRIRDLHIPADMYDVGSSALHVISSELPHLEHLSWGFDYKSPLIQVAFTESFLPRMRKLRKITFLSLQLPSGWMGMSDMDLAFDAPSFHDFMVSNSKSMPSSLRHVRYEHLIPRDSVGLWQSSVYYYCRQHPSDRRRWLELDRKERERLFEEDLTPQLL
ncbi:hypothetical protein ACLMJK_006987 [Lecanora helva]